MLMTFGLLTVLLRSSPNSLPFGYCYPNSRLLRHAKDNRAEDSMWWIILEAVHGWPSSWAAPITCRIVSGGCCYIQWKKATLFRRGQWCCCAKIVGWGGRWFIQLKCRSGQSWRLAEIRGLTAVLAAVWCSGTSLLIIKRGWLSLSRERNETVDTVPTTLSCVYFCVPSKAVAYLLLLQIPIQLLEL